MTTNLTISGQYLPPLFYRDATPDKKSWCEFSLRTNSGLQLCCAFQQTADFCFNKLNDLLSTDVIDCIGYTKGEKFYVRTLSIRNNAEATKELAKTFETETQKLAREAEIRDYWKRKRDAGFLPAYRDGRCIAWPANDCVMLPNGYITTKIDFIMDQLGGKEVTRRLKAAGIGFNGPKAANIGIYPTIRDSMLKEAINAFKGQTNPVNLDAAPAS